MISSFSSNTYAKYVGISKWGSNGTGDGQFQNPGGIAADSKGNVFVADFRNNRIQMFQFADPCSSGKQVAAGVCFIMMWGGVPSIYNGNFGQPSDVAVDSKGNLFVADTANNRILKFQLANPCPSGTTQVVTGICFIRMWNPAYGSGDGEFKFPVGIAVGSKGKVFVADQLNNRIQVFQFSDPCPSGTQLVPGVCFITKWGSEGKGYGEFQGPVGIAVDSKGNVFVTDSGNNRIQVFQFSDPCSSGKQVAAGVCFVNEWGTQGNGISEFQGPSHIAVDSKGNVFVTDSGNNRIQEFTIPVTTGASVPFITEWGSKGSGDGEFQGLTGFAVRPTPNICSVDIAWYNGNARNYHFVIATSTDGTTFTNVFSGDSSGTTLNSEKYIIPATNARYIKVTVNGNTANTWASITELDVFGASSPTGSCTNNLPISGVTASGNDGNVPQNVLDGILGTRWSSLGVGQFITANLESKGEVVVADTGNNRIQVFIDDIIPPKVTIKDPISGTTLTAPTSVEIRAGATDNIGVKQVQFFANSISGGNILLGTDTTSPYRFPLSGLSPDKYVLTAKAYDTAGNTQISNGVTVEVIK